MYRYDEKDTLFTLEERLRSMVETRVGEAKERLHYDEHEHIVRSWVGIPNTKTTTNTKDFKKHAFFFIKTHTWMGRFRCAPRSRTWNRSTRCSARC